MTDAVDAADDAPIATSTRVPPEDDGDPDDADVVGARPIPTSTRAP